MSHASSPACKKMADNQMSVPLLTVIQNHTIKLWHQSIKSILVPFRHSLSKLQLFNLSNHTCWAICCGLVSIIAFAFHHFNVIHLLNHLPINYEIGLLGWLLILINLCFAYISFRNVQFLEQTSKLKPYTPHPTVKSPKLSVLLPARNEENNIERCLNSLLNQTYDNYEILVMNDASTDRTEEILQRIVSTHAQKHRLRTFKSDYLPPNWYGKAYACQQLAQFATGDMLLVTDADTVHQPTSLAFGVATLLSNDYDFISGHPYQNLTSIGQRIFVPVVYLMSTFLMPIWLMDHTRSEEIAFAIGQYKLYKRRVFEAVGGYSSISDEICEDVQMARLLKRSSYRIKFVDVKHHVLCNMYDGYWSAFQGVAKTLFSALNHRILNFGFSLFFVILVTIPVVHVPAQLALLHQPVWSAHLVCIGIFTSVWTHTLCQRDYPPFLVLLYPIMFLSLLLNTIYAFRLRFLGNGFQWKNRYVK